MPMQDRILRALIHAAAAGAFFFIFQRFVLNQPDRDSIIFSGALALAAAGLSWYQTTPKR